MYVHARLHSIPHRDDTGWKQMLQKFIWHKALRRESDNEDDRKRNQLSQKPVKGIFVHNATKPHMRVVH